MTQGVAVPGVGFSGLTVKRLCVGLVLMVPAALSITARHHHVRAFGGQALRHTDPDPTRRSGHQCRPSRQSQGIHADQRASYKMDLQVQYRETCRDQDADVQRRCHQGSYHRGRRR